MHFLVFGATFLLTVGCSILWTPSTLRADWVVAEIVARVHGQQAGKREARPASTAAAASATTRAEPTAAMPVPISAAPAGPAPSALSAAGEEDRPIPAVEPTAAATEQPKVAAAVVTASSAASALPHRRLAGTKRREPAVAADQRESAPEPAPASTRLPGMLLPTGDPAVLARRAEVLDVAEATPADPAEPEPELIPPAVPVEETVAARQPADEPTGPPTDQVRALLEASREPAEDARTRLASLLAIAEAMERIALQHGAP